MKINKIHYTILDEDDRIYIESNDLVVFLTEYKNTLPAISRSHIDAVIKLILEKTNEMRDKHE